MDTGKVKAPTTFQVKRITEAVSAARIYLGGSDTRDMARSMGLTSERVAQIIRLGIDHMTKAGWLRPADSSPSLSGQGRG